MTDLAVIMSVYQNDKLSFVKESVQSILDQTFSQFHYYIIFDGPVASEIDDYITSLNDNRIKHYRLEKNGGLAAALNFLLEIVLKNPEYKYIARMDADDISMPERFIKQREFLKANPDISVVGCWYEEIDESGRHLSYRRLPSDHDALRKRYLTRTPLAHPSVIYRCELIEKAGYYPTDTVLMEDNILWGRALSYDLRFANVPETLIQYRIDSDFYMRRSGLHYGYCFIRTKCKLGKMNGNKWYYIVVIFFVGLIKMLPAFLIEIYYGMILEKKPPGNTEMKL
ncbi:MAG: glycosyltransferase [Bacteroidetes bacterium]|nr:MAG: glycosyltransferase [Bacteroidota bacterium]